MAGYMFQFLIGSLKTLGTSIVLLYHHKFQFLIGSLKTKKQQKNIKKTQTSFNSL